MKYPFIVILAFSLTHAMTAQELQNAQDSLSYSLGMIIGKNIKMQGLENFSETHFIQALKASMKGEEGLMKPSEAEAYFSSYQSNKREEKIVKSKEEGQAFLKENAKKPGVQTTESGLQYEVLVEGEGKMPKANDRVVTHYHGMLINGDVFDSSVERGEPLEFGLNEVIKGWSEVLQLMPVGSKYKAYIPYDLAYGERGAGNVIPPYATLIFEIELLEIK